MKNKAKQWWTKEDFEMDQWLPGKEEEYEKAKAAFLKGISINQNFLTQIPPAKLM